MTLIELRARFEYAPFVHWADNFVAEAGDADVWENAKETADKLVKSGANSDHSKVWKRFKLSQWRRKRVTPLAKDFHHQIPASGGKVEE